MSSRPPTPPAVPDARPLLIAAVSGRALAVSAARGGYPVVVVDFFGDRDTRAAARTVRVVAAPRALRFDRRALLAAARELASPDGWAGIVPGSGFEARPLLLGELVRDHACYGNPPGLVALLKDPARFFPLLERLGLRHPAVRLTPPPEPAGWLVKRVGGSGGVHVRPAARGAPRAGVYYQRAVEGRLLSATFLADGVRAAVLGFNDQWTAGTTQLPYLYAGAASRATLPPRVQEEVSRALRQLVEATGLVGLGSLDFILSEDGWFVLEVNPRPTATADLYDPDYPRGLFDAHLRACAGSLPPGPPPLGPSRAHAIVTAPERWLVPGAFEFPAWACDVPMPGTLVPAGAPVCTVIAEGASALEAATAARARQAELRARVGVDLGSAVGA